VISLKRVLGFLLLAAVLCVHAVATPWFPPPSVIQGTAQQMRDRYQVLKAWTHEEINDLSSRYAKANSEMGDILTSFHAEDYPNLWMLYIDCRNMLTEALEKNSAATEILANATNAFRWGDLQTAVTLAWIAWMTALDAQELMDEAVTDILVLKGLMGIVQ
jgi:hypothetical protein